jgi:hypothetical protein
MGPWNNSTNSNENEHSKRQRTRTWKYALFPIPTHQSSSLSWKLVLEGVKMGAVVAVNGVTIGSTQDQFLRYLLNVDDSVLQLSSSTWNNNVHELTITFDPYYSPTVHLHGRFTACSGGWDWTPYAQEVDIDGISMFTFGIVQPLYLVGVHNHYITNVVPKIYYQGTYPTKPMVENGSHADFLLQVHVHSRTNTYDALSTNQLVLRTEFGNQVAVSIPPLYHHHQVATR